MASSNNRIIQRILLSLAGLVVFSACSRGGLYDGTDETWSYAPIVSTVPGDDFSAYNLSDSYNSENRLFFGVGNGYSEVVYLSTEKVSDTNNKEPESYVTRYLIRHTDPIDLQSAILQPESDFNLFKDAECILTQKGTLKAEDQCDGASQCQLYRVDSILTDAEGRDCGWPTIGSFVVKFDRKLTAGEILEPGTESWLGIESLNYFGVNSKAIRISPDYDPFSSVVGTATSNGFVFAGKKFNDTTITASFPDKVGTTPIRTVNLPDVNAATDIEKAQTKNVLLVASSKGLFKIHSTDNWETLPLPTGLAAMPLDVKKIHPVNGAGLAAFRFVYKEAGAEKNLILVYTEADNKVQVIDHSKIVLQTGVPAGTIPAGWNLQIVNESLWFWNPLAPTLGRKYDDKAKEWVSIEFSLPIMPEAGAYPKYQIVPAGSGFAVSISHDKQVAVISRNSTDTAMVAKKVYRYFYYDMTGEPVGNPITTFSPPHAMHVLNGKAYFERVKGLGDFGELKTMNFGYIYDFVTGKGKMFSDRGFKKAVTSAEERLAEYAGIIVSDGALLFYGGCKVEEDGVQCVGVSANSLARFVETSSF